MVCSLLVKKSRIHRRRPSRLGVGTPSRLGSSVRPSRLGVGSRGSIGRKAMFSNYSNARSIPIKLFDFNKRNEALAKAISHNLELLKQLQKQAKSKQIRVLEPDT